MAVTAIEDKLQDNVPDTLRSLRAMGIRLWVLTGDKLETAISIGFSSRTLVNSDLVLALDGSTLSDQGTEDESVSAASVRQVLKELRDALHEREEDEESDGDGDGSDDDDIDAASPRSSKADTAARVDSAMNETPANSSVPKGQPKPEHVGGPASRRPRHQNSDDNQASTLESDREAAAHQLTLTCQELSAKFPCLRVHNTPAVVSDPQAQARIRELRIQRFEQQHKAGQKQVVGGASVAVVITGKFLSIAMDDGPLQDILRDILLSCSTVLACRVSPLQKAELVGLVKDGMVPKPTTLAIGDGANDVGMIQRADVGIGIFGREGLQAANISDIAINEFQHLYRILQYHGRGNYRRLAIVIKYVSFGPHVYFLAVLACGWVCLRYIQVLYAHDIYFGLLGIAFSSQWLSLLCSLSSPGTTGLRARSPSPRFSGRSSMLFWCCRLQWSAGLIVTSRQMQSCAFRSYTTSAAPIPTSLLHLSL